MVARRPPRRQGGCSALHLAMHKTDDILDCLHGFGGDRLRALRTLCQYGVDIDRVLHQLFHLGADQPEFADSEIDQRTLEGRELPAAKLPEHLGFRHPLQRGIDADQVVGFGARRQALFFAGQRLGIGLCLADLQSD